jgi:transcriptional regulator with XRE-family HTH domain
MTRYKTQIKKRFGMSVKGLRIQLGISQEKLAERTNLHRTYISDIECGSRNVSLENIDRLARALEVSVSHLFHNGTPKCGPQRGQDQRPQPKEGSALLAITQP